MLTGTLEQTLRRLTRGPHPGDVAGLLTDEEAEEAKATVETLRQGDAGIGPNDAYIAAMADILDDAVLTENTADFEALGVATERY